MPFTAAHFLKVVSAEFPELREELEEDEDLPHLQMADFARFTEAAFTRGDWETYGRCLQVAARLWSDPDPELKNLLNVSFFENLEFRGPNGERAWNQLTPELQQGWRQMDEYWTEIMRSRGEGKS